MRLLRTSWLVCAATAFTIPLLGFAGEDPTAPVLPEEKPAPPLNTPERPRIRYWLDEPTKTQPADVDTSAGTSPAQAEVPSVQPVGNEPIVIDERTAAARDACGRREALEAQIKGKLEEAKRAFKRGDYQCSLNIARSILEADPRNVVAAEMLRKSLGKQLDSDERVTRIAGERRDREALLEADEHAVRPPAKLPSVRPHLPRRGEGEDTARRQKMTDKLNERVTFDFIKADLEWVLNTLFILTGVNIIADPAALEGKSLTLHVEDLPLKEVLEFIVRNNEGIQYNITEDAVWITSSQATDLKKVMYPKIYPIHHGLVSTATGGGASSGSGGGGGGGGTGGGRTRNRPTGGGGQQNLNLEPSYLETILKWMKEAKDPNMLPDGSDYIVDRQSNQVVVFTTSIGHDVMARFLDHFDQPAIQVLIKTRFLDISAENEKELGVNLTSLSRQINIGTGTPGNPVDAQGTVRDPKTGYSFTGGATSIVVPGNLGPGNVFQLIGRRTDPTFQLTLDALMNNRLTKILSEPQILALNNKEATINIDTEFSYITDLRPETTTQLGGTGVAVQSVSAFVPEFEKDTIGFSLLVTPSVGRDLKTINLHLNPIIDTLAQGQTISQFQNFQVTQTDTTTGTATPPVIQRPTIDYTTLETDVVLEDNGYVIIGGLVRNRMENRERKVPGLSRIPYLGGLFRSKSTTMLKSNLMIIVEAQIITPGGRIYFKDPEPDDVDVREGGVPRAPGQVSEVHRPDAVNQALGLASRKFPTPGVPSALPGPRIEPKAMPAQAVPPPNSGLADAKLTPREQMERLARINKPTTAQVAARAGWALPPEDDSHVGASAVRSDPDAARGEVVTPARE